MKKNLFFGLFFLAYFPCLFAQKFELVEKAEFEEYYKKPIYVPDVRLHGEYQYYSLSYQDSSSDTNSAWQNFGLQLKSEVQEDVHLFLNLTNTPYDWGANSRNSYTIYDRELRSESNQNLGINIREFYLEYNANPHAVFRVGRQKINLGDKLGFIYKGEVDAFTLTCRIGTWCYELGQANLDADSSRVTWLQFFYPVYESETSIQNYWIATNKERKQSALNVDFYRINDKQNRLALAAYGGRTYDPIEENNDKIYAIEHLQHPDQQDNAQYVFYDRTAESYGVNLSWLKNSFTLYFHAIQSIIQRDYYYEDDTAISDTKRDIAGRLYRLEWQQLAGPNSQFGIASLFTSGNEHQEDADENLPWLDNSSYYEWNRGSYEDGSIYFGSDYRGQQHSITNLQATKIYYKFHGDKYNIDVITQLFQFSRNKKILSTRGNLVDNIGTEIDLSIEKELASNLRFQIDLGYFLVGAAYSPSSSIQPTETFDNVTQYSLGLNYKF